MTKLIDYLISRRLSIRDFSSLCECSRQHIHNVKNGSQRISKKLVKKIEEVTNGEVTRYDLLKNDKDKITKV